jgi:hypothetical protein
MAGRVKALIEELLEVRTRSADGTANAALVPFVRAHLIIRGINPDHYSTQSPDDPKVVSQIERMIEEFRRP